MPTLTVAPTATSQLTAYHSLPSGNYVVYYAEISRDGETIFTDHVISVDGSVQRQISEGLAWRVASPDRRYVPFVQGTLITLLDLEHSTTIDIPGTEACYYLDWSPDGIQLAVVCNDYDIKIISLSDGTSKLLLSDPDKLPTISGYSDLRWSPDGKWLAYYRWNASPPGDAVSVMVMDLSCVSDATHCIDKTYQLFTVLWHVSMTWTPGGHLAIIRDPFTDGHIISIYEIRNNNPVLLQTLHADRQAGRITGMAWSPDDKWVAVNQEDGEGILLLPVSGGEPIRLEVPGTVETWLIVP